MDRFSASPSSLMYHFFGPLDSVVFRFSSFFPGWSATPVSPSSWPRWRPLPWLDATGRAHRCWSWSCHPKVWIKEYQQKPGVVKPYNSNDFVRPATAYRSPNSVVSTCPWCCTLPTMVLEDPSGRKSSPWQILRHQNKHQTSSYLIGIFNVFQHLSTQKNSSQFGLTSKKYLKSFETITYLSNRRVGNNVITLKFKISKERTQTCKDGPHVKASGNGLDVWICNRNHRVAIAFIPGSPWNCCCRWASWDLNREAAMGSLGEDCHEETRAIDFMRVPASSCLMRHPIVKHDKIRFAPDLLCSFVIILLRSPKRNTANLFRQA